MNWAEARRFCAWAPAPTHPKPALPNRARATIAGMEFTGRFRKRLLRGLSIVAICHPVLFISGQTGIELAREVHLPISRSRGTYSHYPIPGLASRDQFSLRVAPDQSILVFDSDTSGNWPLVRIREWWTENPASEVLAIPGWRAADKKDIAQIYVDVQATPDGRYAVTFSGAMWRDKSDFLFHAPKGYVQRPSDTIITVIDLDRWQIVNSIHTASLGEIQIRDARVMNERWIAFDDSHSRQSPSEYGAYPISNVLISIPDLKLGPECVSQRISHIWQRPPDSVAESIRKQNDLACQGVLKATGVDFERALELLIQRGSDVEPDTMRIHMLDAVARGLPNEANLWTAEGNEEEFFRYWGEYPYYENYAENPPFESSSRLWYGLYDAHEPPFYELSRYNAKGEKQTGRTERHLLCGDPSLDSPKSACGCRVVDVSEESRTLLAYCRTQHGDYDGMFQRQWLSVFRSDDLSGEGFISLGKDVEALQAIANRDGRAYAVTLEHGETLRIYPVSGRP